MTVDTYSVVTPLMVASVVNMWKLVHSSLNNAK